MSSSSSNSTSPPRNPSTAATVPKPRPSPIDTRRYGGTNRSSTGLAFARTQLSAPPHISQLARRAKISPGLPLFPTPTWSPTAADFLETAYSVSEPPKISWEQYLLQLQARGHSSSNALTTTSPVTDAAAPSTSLDLACATRTREEHHISSMQQPTANKVMSDPLIQQPFGTSRLGVDLMRSRSHESDQEGMPLAGLSGDLHDTVSLSPTDSSGDQSSTDNQSSALRVADEQHFQRDPEQIGDQGDVWTEQPHSRALRRALMDPNIDWFETYAGALATLTAINPEQYQMPYGTRVCNIKTEYAGNFVRSIRSGKYSTLKKVAERIMLAWNEREHPSEKVILLCSINGSKKYMGIAELSGPWVEHEQLYDWEENPTSAPCVGAFPITWIYVKDAPYQLFEHIRQPVSGHPVGNMWNGMTFSHGLGRQVIECYVKAPAVYSILAHPKDPYADMAQVLGQRAAEGQGDYRVKPSQRRCGQPQPQSVRGRRVLRNDSAPIASDSWRQPIKASSPTTDGNEDSDRTPLASKARATPVVEEQPAPKFHLPDTEERPSENRAIGPFALRPGQIITAMVDENANLVPFTQDDSPSRATESTDDVSIKSVAQASDHGIEPFPPYHERSQMPAPKRENFAQAALGMHNTLGDIANATAGNDMHGAPSSDPGMNIEQSSTAQGPVLAAHQQDNPESHSETAAPDLPQAPVQAHDPQAAPVPQHHVIPGGVPGGRYGVRDVYHQPLAAYYWQAEGDRHILRKTPRSCFPTPVDETPTHRPLSHLTSQSKHGEGSESRAIDTTDPHEERLRAQYYSLIAQCTAIQHELSENVMQSRIRTSLEQQLDSFTEEMLSVEAQLVNLDFAKPLAPASSSSPVLTRPYVDPHTDANGYHLSPILPPPDCSPLIDPGRPVLSTVLHSGYPGSGNGGVLLNWDQRAEASIHRSAHDPQVGPAAGINRQQSHGGELLGMGLHRPSTADSGFGYETNCDSDSDFSNGLHIHYGDLSMAPADRYPYPGPSPHGPH